MQFELVKTNLTSFKVKQKLIVEKCGVLNNKRSRERERDKKPKRMFRLNSKNRSIQ